MEEEQKTSPDNKSDYQPSYVNGRWHEQTCFQIQYGSKFLNIHPDAVEYRQELKITPMYGAISPYTEMFVTGRIPTKERIEAYNKTNSSPVLPIGHITRLWISKFSSHHSRRSYEHPAQSTRRLSR